MLYDPKWEAKPKPAAKPKKSIFDWFRTAPPKMPADVFEINDFMGSVDAKHPAEKYDYTQPMDCAMARYLQERGVKGYSCSLAGASLGKIYPGIIFALNGCGENTYGALSGRLRRIARPS